jgi:hypothetical protein
MPLPRPRIWNALDGSQLPIVLRTTVGTFVGLGTAAAPTHGRSPAAAQAAGVALQPWEEDEWAEGGSLVADKNAEQPHDVTVKDGKAKQPAQQLNGPQQRPGGSSTGAIQEAGGQGAAGAGAGNQLDEDGPPTGGFIQRELLWCILHSLLTGAPEPDTGKLASSQHLPQSSIVCCQWTGIHGAASIAFCFCVQLHVLLLLCCLCRRECCWPHLLPLEP